jgi:hypothetical protein
MAKKAKSSVGLKVGKPSVGEKKKGLALAALTEKNLTVRVNFDLNRDEHIKLKVYAARAGRSVADVLRDFVDGLE